MSLRVRLLFLAALVAESGGILKIPAQARRLPPELAAHRQHRFRKSGLVEDKEQELRFNPKFQQSAASTLELNTTIIDGSYYYVFFANISIGTPAQVFRMEIDPWYYREMCVLGTEVNDTTATKKFFDKSNSSTYIDIGKNFYMNSMAGKNGTDVVNVGNVSAAVTFGITQNVSSWIRDLPIDGILGINPAPPVNNNENAISQLLGGLGSPIMTWWQNVSTDEEKKQYSQAQLTLGGEDTDHCESSYVYAPRVTRNGRRYPVHLTSAVISDGDDYDQPENRFDINVTLAILGHGDNVYGPPAFFYALTNATNATYDQFYTVDCDLSKHKDIVLNIGGSGVTEDETSRQIVLYPANYIEYRKNCFYKLCGHFFCCLSVHEGENPYGDENHRVELGKAFLNNHCLAYNSKEDKIGFSDVKEKKLTI